MLVDKPLKLFSLNANIPLAKQVAKSLGVELSKCSVKKFKITSTDYELFVRLKGDMYKIYNNIVL